MVSQAPAGHAVALDDLLGHLMLVICAATARLLYGSSAAVGGVRDAGVAVALSLTLTRGAWVGVAVGVAVLFLSKDFRLLAVIPIVVVGGILLAPQEVIDRGKTMFDRKDLTSLDRVAMLQAGVAIVKDYPLTGVGPDQIERVYPRYRVAGAVKATNPHLHNVPMQIAAERGLPALGAWIWFVIAAFAACQAGADRAEQEPLRRGARRHGGDARRGIDGVQLRRFRVPDAAARDHHVAVRGQSRRRTAVVNISLLPAISTARAHALIDHFASRRITVVGDVMLDRFLIGRVNRMSPEAPVPVVVFDHEEVRLGGAANVANNLRELGAAVD